MSFIRHYLDPYLAAGTCTQFIDDIESEVTEFSQLLPSLRKFFECIRKCELKLSPKMFKIASQSIKFLGSIITDQVISTQTKKIQRFLKKITLPKWTKQVKRIIRFTQFFKKMFTKSFFPKLISFYKLFVKYILNLK